MYMYRIIQSIKQKHSEQFVLLKKGLRTVEKISKAGEISWVEGIVYFIIHTV